MFSKIKKSAAVITAVASAAVVSLPAHAAAGTGIDVSGVVTEIAAQATPIGLIGGGVLLIYVAVKAFKWVRSALS